MAFAVFYDMRTFAYRHWDAEQVFVGDWAEPETQLHALHDALWSDSPPGLRADADVAALTALGELDHPLARALFLMYHAVGQRMTRGASEIPSLFANELLRHAARRVLQDLPIAHVDAAAVPRILARAAVSPTAGAYVRWTAVLALQAVAQAPDADLLIARLVPAAPRESDEEVEERVETVWSLVALVEREPALLSSIGLADRLLTRIEEDPSVAVRIAAVQALMATSPRPRVCAALHALVDSEVAAKEVEWAATIALFGHAPAATAALVLAVHRRSTRPEEFSALFTQLELRAEEAALRIALLHAGGPAPLIWRNPDCSVFALCQADGRPPPGADDPELPDLTAQWMTAELSARAALLSRMAASGHAAGRALAVIAGPPTDSEQSYYGDEDEESLASDPAALPIAEVDWLTLARQVLTDPPLTRLDAVQGRILADQVTVGLPEGAAFPSAVGQLAANHRAAIELIGKLGEPADGELLIQYLLRDSVSQSEPLLLTTLDALYWHSRRSGQPLVGDQFFMTVTALARAGSSEVRRRAVLLLGCFAETVSGDLLRELAHDPTNTVCCIAERALSEQKSG